MKRLAAPLCSLFLALGLTLSTGAADAAPRHRHHVQDDAPDRSGEKVHIVSQGQTLAKIAKRYKVRVEDIREANDLAPGVKLKVGERLVIPQDEGGGSKRAKSDGRDDDSDDDRGSKGRKRGDRDDDDERASSGKRRGGREDEDDDRGGRRGHDQEGGRGGHQSRGYVHLVHGSESWEGKVTDKKGKVAGKAVEGFSHLLRASSGKKHSIDPRLVSLVAQVSDHFNGRTLEVVSGFRPFTTTQYTPKSRHNRGNAIDFHVRGVSNEELRDFCHSFHNVGVGYYPNSSFVHLDVRETSATWVDYAHPGEAPRYNSPDEGGRSDDGADADSDHDGKGSPDASPKGGTVDAKATDEAIKPAESATAAAGEGSKKTSTDSLPSH